MKFFAYYDDPDDPAIYEVGTPIEAASAFANESADMVDDAAYKFTVRPADDEAAKAHEWRREDSRGPYAVFEAAPPSRAWHVSRVG